MPITAKDKNWAGSMKYYLNKVICGDCLEVMKDIPDKSVDLVLTDPPYGIDYQPNWKKWNGMKSDFNRIEGDTMSFNPNSILKYDKVVIFGANYFSDKLKSGGWIIWDKRLTENRDKMFGDSIEMAWQNIDTKNRIFRILHGGVINDDSKTGNNAKRYHPTQKPVNLFKKIILDFTEVGDTILDPFLGSGTTAVAAKQLGRNYIGIEINPDYCKIAEQRLAQTELF